MLFVHRDADVRLEESWLFKRDSSNDSVVLSNFVKTLKGTHNQSGIGCVYSQ